MAGLSFADENEAMAFYNKVLNRDNLRVQPRTSSKFNGEPNGSLISLGVPSSPSTLKPPTSFTPAAAAVSGGATKKKGKIDKSQIGTPSNFRHLTHIGWDPDRGFSVCSRDGSGRFLDDCLRRFLDDCSRCLLDDCLLRLLDDCSLPLLDDCSRHLPDHSACLITLLA